MLIVRRKSVFGIMLTLLLIGMLTLAFNIQPTKAEPKTWIVDDDGPADFHTIQEAINAANPGDTIFVYNGTYYENVHIDESLRLIGEDKSTTIIDGVTSPSEYYVVGLDADNITFTGFTVKNGNFGVHLNHKNCVVEECNIWNNTCGIVFEWGPLNTIKRNTIWNNTYGIAFTDSSHCNILEENTVSYSDLAVYVEHSRNLSIYHNNFISNTVQVEIGEGGNNSNWDDGYPSGGNYWSDYIGLDADGDGIGDTPYVIDENNTDRYPLMHPWSSLPVHNMNTGLGYAAIQEAINANETLNGHTIFVEAGIYCELVVVNKTIRLIGEGKVVTIIDGKVDVTANNVIVNGFAIGGFTAFITGGKMDFGIRLSGGDCIVNNNTFFYTKGIWLLNSTDNVISNNVLIANDHNVYLSESSNNTISQNHIRSMEWKGGIMLMYSGIELDRSSNNTIIQNNITQCEWGIKIEGRTLQYASKNRIIENNIEYIHYDGFGISLDWSSNSTIVRNKIAQSDVGISLDCSLNNSIIENDIRENGRGIKLVDSSLNNITDNNLMNNYYGILLQASQVNSLIRNNITHSPVTITPEHGGSNKTVRVGYGILIKLCYYGSNTLRYNNITGYRYNFGVEGYMDRYVQDVDATNTVDGKPVYYWVNQRNGEIPSDAGYVAIINSTDIRVEGLDLKNNYQGILIAYSNNTTIHQNNITNSDYGIFLVHSLNNTISESNIENNGYGIYLGYSSNNSVSGSNIKNNNQGIWLESSSNNSIVGNNITNNYYGILLDHSSNNMLRSNVMVGNRYNLGVYGWSFSDFVNIIDASNTVDGKPVYYWIDEIDGTIPADAGYVALINCTRITVQNLNLTKNWQGILLAATTNSTITKNNIANNTIGISLLGFSSSNTISGNNIIYNYDGIYLEYSSNNTIYHNNFINNTQQVQVYFYTSGYYANIWDDGYPSGGNYWSDYTGVDADGDGIGDTPYVIDTDNQDRYPLMNPWGTGTPIANFSWSPATPEVNELVTFDASASMPIGGEIVSYEWDFGDGNYASGNLVTHRYSSAGNYTVTLNVTDSEGLWNIEQKQIEVKAPPPPLKVSISPTSASMLVGQSVTFTSTVSGGYTPYSYQWYLNGNPVAGATSASWTFTPTTSGIYYVYLKVTDAKANTTQSEAARIIVAAVPVGGYSVPIQLPTTAKPATIHIALLAILTAMFAAAKRKTKRKR